MTRVRCLRCGTAAHGFAASGLEPQQAGQQWLFPDPEQERLQRLDQVMDKIRDRYGRRAMHRGAPSRGDSDPVA